MPFTLPSVLQPPDQNLYFCKAKPSLETFLLWDQNMEATQQPRIYSSWRVIEQTLAALPCCGNDSWFLSRTDVTQIGWCAIKSLMYFSIPHDSKHLPGALIPKWCEVSRETTSHRKCELTPYFSLLHF